jgi:hypothetical protein
MVECYWNLKTHKWDVDRFECNTLASQLMTRYSPEGCSIGFHCKDNELEKYYEKLKRTAIRDKEREIKKLQKEIDNLSKMAMPVI